GIIIYLHFKLSNMSTKNKPEVETHVLTQTLIQQFFSKLSLQFFKLELNEEEELDLERIKKNEIEKEIIKRILKIPILPFALIYFFFRELISSSLNMTAKQSINTKKIS